MDIAGRNNKIRAHRNHGNHRKDIALQYQEFVKFVVEKDRVTEEQIISVKSVQFVVEKKDFCGFGVSSPVKVTQIDCLSVPVRWFECRFQIV